MIRELVRTLFIPIATTTRTNKPSPLPLMIPSPTPFHFMLPSLSLSNHSRANNKDIWQGACLLPIHVLFKSNVCNISPIFLLPNTQYWLRSPNKGDYAGAGLNRIPGVVTYVQPLFIKLHYSSPKFTIQCQL